MKNPRKSLGLAGGNRTYFPYMEQKSKITTRWRLQTVIKDSEIKVDNRNAANTDNKKSLHKWTIHNNIIKYVYNERKSYIDERVKLPLKYYLARVAIFGLNIRFPSTCIDSYLWRQGKGGQKQF